jgi:sortase (surface protein transpeptidase)
MRLGLQSDGTVEVPPGPFPAGWYTGSPTPGELGPAVLVGHVHWNDRAGVFADLASLTSGDEVVVRRADGGSAVFRVTRTEQFSKDAFPTARVYGDLDYAGLRLITCGGRNLLTGRYEDNVVVFARLVATG